MVSILRRLLACDDQKQPIAGRRLSGSTRPGAEFATFRLIAWKRTFRTCPLHLHDQQPKCGVVLCALKEAICVQTQLS